MVLEEDIVLHGTEKESKKTNNKKDSLNAFFLWAPLIRHFLKETKMEMKQKEFASEFWQRNEKWSIYQKISGHSWVVHGWNIESPEKKR